MKGGHKRPDLTSASDAKQDRADDLLGAVVPSRGHDDPASDPTPESDLSNVIAFAPRGRKRSEKNAPALNVAPDDRPAPQALSTERQRQIALLIGGSLLLHGAIFAAFNRAPEPHASIGVISLTVDIVLGAQSNAGKSQTPSESEITSAAAPKTDEPADSKPEIARKSLTKQPVEEPKDAEQEAAKTAAPKAPEPLRAETPPEPKAQAELAAIPKPVETPTLTPDQKKPDAKEAKQVREAARHTKDDGESLRDRAAPASTPSNSSNSIGRGRSDLDTNYAGLVAAHLARFKQFPSDAQRRGSQGTATVYFNISGSGSVTSVRLIRGSGISSIDQEATAMVHRASPFPAPPSGRAMAFTRPLIFEIR